MHKYFLGLISFLLLGTYASAFYVVPQKYKDNFASLRSSRIAPGLNHDSKKKQKKVVIKKEFFSNKTITPKNLPRIAPYNLSFHLEPQRLVLQGYVPNRESKVELRDLAFALFPGRDILDRIRLGSGEPGKWRDASIDVLVFLDRFESASATMMTKEILIRIPKGEDLKAEEIETQLGLVLPAGYNLVPLQTDKDELNEIAKELNEKHLLPPKKAKAPKILEQAKEKPKAVAAKKEEASSSIQECQARFNKALAASKVKFQSGSSEIKTESNSLLDTLALIGESCDGLNFEIIGHTDSRGDEVFNQILSLSRAETVLSALQKRGLDGTMMQATGKGSKAPLASNESEAGKSKNRRVEILVKQNTGS